MSIAPGRVLGRRLAKTKFGKFLKDTYDKLNAKYQAFKSKLSEWRSKFNEWREIARPPKNDRKYMPQETYPIPCPRTNRRVRAIGPVQSTSM